MIDLSTLNKEQRIAVETTEGPLLVLAGAGSGKTRVLTYRVAYLMEKGVPPWKILAITFTNKAAKEMLDRVEMLTGEAGKEAWISTFHSCCVRILRRDIEKLQGYTRSFTIYDADDALAVIKAILKEKNLDEKKFPPKQIRAIISDAKNHLLTPDEWFQASEGDALCRTQAEIYALYNVRLKASNCLDFDDLLTKTLELLVEQPPVLDYYQQRFDYVLVDEYQDTNAVQYELVRILTMKKRNLCVVGDDDQSIYGWRGADIRNILEFEKDYPETKTIKLEQNYRSTGNILDAANQVIAHNRGRKEKALWTEADEGNPITVYAALDEREEAEYIGRTAESLMSKGCNPGDIAVLYRTNAQSRILEELFVRKGLKYRVFGGQRFYERKEVKDILAYMRLLVNPGDDVSFRRVINEPKRGIGQSTVDALSEYALNNDMPLMQAAMMVEDTPLGNRPKKLISEFNTLMLDLTENLYGDQPVDFLEKLLEKTNYIRALEAVDSDESRSRIENIKELQGAMTEFQTQNPEATVSDYLENVALISDFDNIDEGGGAITLTTLHSAKGLEFDIVFIPGCEEGIFPTTRALNDEASLEEERRLAYVGITRAKKELYITCARSRMLYNQRNSNVHSRFIDEIPQRLTRRASYRSGVRVPLPAQGYGAALARSPSYVPAAAAPKVVPSAARSVNVLKTYSVGDKVYHRTFGKGTVISTRGEGMKQVIVIEFDRNKKRSEFSSNVAPINKLS